MIHAMQWTDEGIVLGVRRHGEASAILELMTREHGRHLGLVRGGSGSRHAAGAAARQHACARPGGRGSTSISAITWSKACDLRAARFFGASHAVYGVTHLAALMRLLARARSACRICTQTLDAILDRSTMPHARGADGGALRTADARRARLRPRSRAMRGDRRDAPISSMCRRNPAARCRAPRASRGRTRCCGCRLSCATDDAAPAGGDLADGFALTGFF